MPATHLAHSPVAELPRDPEGTAVPPRRVATGVAAEVRDALSRRQRELPAAFLADRAVASVRHALEQAANERLQQVEAPLVQAWSAEHRRQHHVRRVVEFFPAGSASILPLLDARGDQAPVATYLAIDAAPDPAREGAARANAQHPARDALFVSTNPVLPLPIRRATGSIFAMLGGGLGRFPTISAIRVLRAARVAMTVDDVLLLGLDLRSPTLRMDAARDHAALLTEWHRHAMVVANRVAGTDFDPDAYTHALRYDADNRRLDEGLESRSPHRVTGPSLAPFVLRPGELVRTSMQCLYDRSMLEPMLRGVGLRLQVWCESADAAHALAVAQIRFPDDGQP